MSELPLPERLESFLETPPSLPASAELQQTLFKKTAAVLRRPRGRRLWPLVSALAAGIILAIVSIYFALRPDNVASLPKTDLVERRRSAPPAEKAPPVQPRDLEWTAFDAAEDPQRVRLYFRAGDLYFEQYGDYESALVYTQALHYCQAHELEIDPDDNWLVMALKRDRCKER